MTSLPSSLREARSVQVLNEKLQRKDEMIKSIHAQIKMLAADNERLKAGSSRTRAEVARLRAKLRMCRCEHQSVAAMGMHLGVSDEVPDSSLPTPMNNLSAHERLYFESSTRQVKSDRQVDGIRSGGVVYEQMDNRQEPMAWFVETRPHSSASSRRPKSPVPISPVGKPKKEEFHAGIVGVNVRKQSTEAVRKQNTESVPAKNLLPEVRPTVLNQSMNARRRPSAPQKLSVPQAATVRRHSVADSQPTVSLSVLPVSLPEGSPGMIDLAKSRPAGGRKPQMV